MPNKVLIVDDNEDSREILALILGMHGFQGVQAGEASKPSSKRARIDRWSS